VTAHSVDPSGITVIGKNVSGSFNIVFKPGAQFSILNSMPEDPAMPHFLAYYLMGTGSANCTSTPTNDPACAPRATECAFRKLIATTPRKPTVKSTTTIRPKPPQIGPLAATLDCSNSHWP
jgi:hypothetical protein